MFSLSFIPFYKFSIIYKWTNTNICFSAVEKCKHRESWKHVALSLSPYAVQMVQKSTLLTLYVCISRPSCRTSKNQSFQMEYILYMIFFIILSYLDFLYILSSMQEKQVNLKYSPTDSQYLELDVLVFQITVFALSFRYAKNSIFTAICFFYLSSSSKYWIGCISLYNNMVPPNTYISSPVKRQYPSFYKY